MTEDQPQDHTATLLALTRLMSRWSSLDLQRQISAGQGLNLDPTAVRAIYTLGITGGQSTPGQIASDLHLSRPSASKLIARLIRSDILVRTKDPDDGRSAQLKLTATGQAAFERLFAAGIDMITSATASWSPEDMRQLTLLLPRFVGGLIADEAPPL